MLVDGNKNNMTSGKGPNANELGQEKNLCVALPTISWYLKSPFRIPHVYVCPYERLHELLILDTDKKLKYEDGKAVPIGGLSKEKIEILHLLSDACLNFWKISPHIREENAKLQIYYAVTQCYIEGLCVDLLQPFSSAQIDPKWVSVNEIERVRYFSLSFPSNYRGAIKDYVVIDECIRSNGTYHTARTIQRRYI